MGNTSGILSMIVAGLLAFPGCSSLTEPQVLTDFDWGEVEDPTTIEERVESQVVLGDLYVLGQFRTPTRCYSLDFDFGRSGSRLTLRLEAKSSDSPTCEQSQGGYRYTLVIRNLEFGTYELRVNHDITGAQGGQFTETVTIR